ncbi:hypothetical protein AB0B89_36430, partial [Sphaerisporangium sp. NPDC049002]
RGPLDPPAVPLHRGVAGQGAGGSRDRGDLNPSTRETRDVRWLTAAQLQELADRTVAYARGSISTAEFEANPGMEPVWVQWYVAAGVVTCALEDLDLIDTVAAASWGSM